MRLGPMPVVARGLSFPGTLLALLFVLGSLGEPPILWAQEARDGLFVSVPNPITDDAVAVIELKIKEAARRRPLSVVVFDFNPQDQPSGASKWNSCNALAEFILNLRRGQVKGVPSLTTIAFVHNEVTRHTVLPVLACKQIIMSDAIDPSTRLARTRLGDVKRGLEEPFTAAMKVAYAEVARHFPSPDLIARMIDKDLPLKKIRTASGPRYVTPQTMQEMKDSGETFTEDPDLPDFLQPGNALFEPRPAADPVLGLGLCSGIKNSRAELAEALGLPRHSVVEDWLAGRTKVPWLIEVRSPLDKGKLASLERKIGTALKYHANFILLHLDAEGGDTTHVASTAEFVRKLRDDTQMPVKTVAYVPPGRTLGSAVFLALGCNEIVLGKDAVLADFNYVDQANVPTLKDMLLPLAKEQGYPPLLFEAALTRDLVLYRVKARDHPTLLRPIREAAFLKDKESKEPRWLSFGRVAPEKGHALRITASLAAEFGVAAATNLNTLDDVYAHYGLDALKVRVARDDWLDAVAEFFREPWVNFLLIMLGIAGLILEMKMPGTTIPGVVAAICFVLFFWSYSFVGEFTLLAVLLFVLGLILIGTEVFVLPGTVFPGIAGVVLIVSSLVLVTLDRMPHTAQDFGNLAATLGTFGLSLVAAIAAAVLLAWYLPSIPYANRLILEPPSEEGADETAFSGVSPALLGAIGVASTTLRPAGKAQFGDEFYDVITEGDFVQPGARVQVIEIEGNRIVVKEI